MSKKVKALTIILFLIVLALLGWFMVSGENYKLIQSMFSDDLSGEEFKELLRSFGIKGGVTLGVLSMLQVVLTFLPAEPVQVLAGIGYGVWRGVLICLAGVFVGNTLIYIMFKSLGDKLSKYFEKNIDIEFDKIKNTNRLVLIIFVLYFLPAIPYGLICFFTATMQVKFPRYITLTTIGAIPSIIIGVCLGHVAIATSWIVSLIIFIVIISLIIVATCNRKALFKKVNEFIAKVQKEHTTDTIVKNGNVFWTRIFAQIAWILVSPKVKFKYPKKVKINGPAIVLFSHESFFDFIYALKIFNKNHLNFMVARMYFYNKFLAKGLRAGGMFPKSMLSADVENVMNSVRVLKSNGVLAFMPEARLSTAGEFEDIQPTTIKFIKKMNVPVYAVRLEGAYLANPKWGNGFRWGALVEATFTTVADKEQIASIDEQTLRDKVESALYYNDFKWLESHPELKYRNKKIAQGLENILFKCPSCGAEHSLNTKGKKLWCSKCDLSLTINLRYEFNKNEYFNNFYEWYLWQCSQLEKEIKSNSNYLLSDKVELYHGSKDGKKLVSKVGDGVCSLDIKGLIYRGTDNGEVVEKVFPMSFMYRLLFGAGENFEIYDNKEIYYFAPEDKRNCVKWYVASRILKDLSQEKNV